MDMGLPMLRRAGLVLAVSTFALAGLARADDPVPPRNEAAAPSGQKGVRGGNAQQNATQTSPSASPEVKPNAETWLDFTDLVFIDPVGTGYSRFIASGDDARKRFYSVEGDVNSIALVIRRWLEKHNRLVSPKYVAGESYGGIRGPKVVRQLQLQHGVGVRGLILVSPLLDFR